LEISKGDFEAAYKVNFNDSKWESVTVPHDWAIYGPFDVDIQKVAIVQNGENVATENGRTGACLISTRGIIILLLAQRFKWKKILLL
jgi:hypothetical protein